MHYLQKQLLEEEKLVIARLNLKNLMSKKAKSLTWQEQEKYLKSTGAKWKEKLSMNLFNHTKVEVL